MFWGNIIVAHFGGVVNIDDNIDHEWIRISHFYRPFYVYKYATSYTCANYIASSILENKNNMKEKYFELLKSGGRIAVITFHSLEDKIVKEIFKKAVAGETWNRNMPINVQNKASEYRLITKKPILPSEEELKVNNRAHSAKLRIIEKI